MSEEPNDSTNSQYLNCTQLCEKYTWLPMGGLRHLIFHADSNGFHKVIRRVGRRILLREDEFLRFIEEGGNNAQLTTTDGNKKQL